MEFIEISTQEKKELTQSRWRKYWFPMPKGFNRILVVIACLIIVYTVYDYPDKVDTFFFTLAVEIAIYVAAIWIYRGFKELPKD